MNAPKRNLLIGALLLLLLALAVGIFVYLRGAAAAEPSTLKIVHTFGDPDTEQALREALGAYGSLHPKLKIDILALPPRPSPEAIRTASADLLILGEPMVAERSPYLESPVPWSGSLWVLAARKDYLEGARRRQAEAVEALKAGRATPAQFESLLADAASLGLAPITLGNSHRWPFLLWLQCWTAATSGPESAIAIPSLRPAGESVPPAGGAVPDAPLAAAFKDLMRWKASGWFAASVWKEGWAKGLGPLDRGEAAFALVSSSSLSAISPEGRAALEYLPLPRREGDAPWSLGHALFLGIAKETKQVEAARELLRFLSSPGTTSQLARRTGKPFFAWDAKTGLSPKVLPDWSAAAMSAEYEALSRTFNPGQ